MKKLTMTLALACAFAVSADAVKPSPPAGGAAMPDVDKVELDGEYPGHLQDVCRDKAGFLYWAHTYHILKTDMSGKVLVKAEVEGHNAGCEVKDGVLYVAVCPHQNTTGGQTTPECRLQINEYDAETLALRAKHVLPVNDRAGSLAILEDGSFVVGCLRPKDILPSQARFHHVGSDFNLKSTHLLDDVNVRLGIEVIKRRGDTLFMMLCGSPTVMVDAKTFAETGRLEYRGGQTGLIFDGDYYWRGYIRQPEGQKVWKSWIKRCRMDDFMREPMGPAVVLFNGKDLSGWTAVADHDATGGYAAQEPTWSVADGAIRTTGTPFGYLRTKRADYDDFKLKLEYRWWRPAPRPNSGVFVRLAAETGTFIPRCYENQLEPKSVCSVFALGGSVLDGVAPRNPYDPVNALSGIAAVPAKAASSEKPFGEWNALEIEAKGDVLVSRLNGVEMNRVKGVKTAKGAVALQSEGGAVEFRNVVLEPL